MAGVVELELPVMLLAPLYLIAAVFPQQKLPPSGVEARTDNQGQVILEEGGRAILQYNSKQVDLPLGYWDKIAESNRIYAKARSGYLHPLYGLDGEELTLDWSLDHPHHRGIYWAWPEVQFGKKMGDLHALQAVYSKPVGTPTLSKTDRFAKVEAMNLWLWENKTPVVFERVSIKAHALAKDGSRTIDLHLEFEALAEGVTLARRGTNLYGGLNVRMAPVKDLEFGHLAETSKVKHAWSTTTGIWKGGKRQTTLSIIEHADNPDFPADFITYENLPWFQPTFPRADTRFSLKPGKPLTLQYRFVISPGIPDPLLLAAAAARFSTTTASTKTAPKKQF